MNAPLFQQYLATLQFVREGDFMEFYTPDRALASRVGEALGVAYTKARDHGPKTGQFQVGVPVHAWHGWAKPTLEAAAFEVIGEP